MLSDEKELFKGLGSGLLQPGEEPKFQWLRGGRPFDPEERFKVLFKVSNTEQLAIYTAYLLISFCVGRGL